MNPRGVARSRLGALIAVVLVLIGLAACGSSNSSSTTTPTTASAGTSSTTATTASTSTPAAATTATAASTMMAASPAAGAASPAPGATTIMVATNATLGKILTDANGMTLYFYAKDSNGTSACTGACATNWPPLTAPGAPMAPADATGTVGTIKRDDGSTQVTYNGKPLYTYIKDKAPGDTTGQGVGGVWTVATP